MFSDKFRLNGSNVDRCRVHRRLHERYVWTIVSLNSTNFEGMASKSGRTIRVRSRQRQSHITHKNLGE